MTDQISETLPDEALLALAHTKAELRDALRMFFELDQRLSRLVSASTEPMLGQMRLAWWREMLGKEMEQWPQGDQVLDGVRRFWGERASLLLPLVDAWEHLLAEPPLGASDALSFVEGRRDALLAVFNVEAESAHFKAFSDAAWHWALADLASKVSEEEERTLLVGLSEESGRKGARLPADARGLAVVGALGRRALKRGGRPLMEGRGASLVAIRAAITRL